jgi:hypothetical protein
MLPEDLNKLHQNNLKRNKIMIHFIVGTIAASCVIAGFIIGIYLIFKKNNKCKTHLQ